MQAAAGQWEVSRKSKSIDEVIAGDDTSAELAEQLTLVQAAREFSIEELGLPDNKSYRSYADLERDCRTPLVLGRQDARSDHGTGASLRADQVVSAD